MHTFAYRASRMVWNNQFDEVKKILEPYVQKNPRLAMEYAGIYLTRSTMTGSSEDRALALKQLSSCADVTQSLNSEAKIREYIKSTLELNKKAKQLDLQEIQEGKLPDIYSQKTQSLIQFKDPCLFYSKLEKPIEQWTDKELLQNYEFDLKVLHAEATLFKGVTQMQDNSMIKAAYSLRKAWKEYEQLLKDLQKNDDKVKNKMPDAILYHQDVHDGVLVGVGTFYYLLSVLPPAVAKVLEFIGFTTNREIGIEYLEYVCSQRGFRCITALQMLIINYLMVPSALENKHESLKKFKPHMDFAIEMLPKGGYILFAASSYAKKNGDYDTAVQRLNTAIESSRTKDFEPNMYYFELGLCYCSLRNYEKAMSTFEYIMAMNTHFEFKSASGLALAVCYVKLGKIPQANSTLPKLAKLAEKKTRGDKYVIDKLKLLDISKSEQEKHLILNVALLELLYLKRDLAHLKPDQIAPLLSDLEVMNTDILKLKQADVKAANYVLRASMNRALGEDEKAADLFKNALALASSIQYEKQWPASAAYERAEQEYLAGRLEQAEAYLKTADSFTKYGFEEVLRSRIKLATKKIQQDLKERKTSSAPKK